VNNSERQRHPHLDFQAVYERPRTGRTYFQPENRSSILLGGTSFQRLPYHFPVFGIDAQGSCFGLGLPFCNSSIDTLSGERMKAM
jgi:hypothetical protein